MKRTIAKRLFAIALAVCAATLLTPTLVSAGDRVEVNQFNFGPLTTRALCISVSTQRSWILLGAVQLLGRFPEKLTCLVPP